VQHCSSEQLALAALQEPLPPRDADHVAGCARCRQEIASLRRGVDPLAVPELAAPAGTVPPPPSVWEAIADRTGVSARPRPEIVASPRLPVPGPLPVPPAEDGGRARVLPLRRRLRVLLAAAAALVVGAGVGAGAVALRGSGGDGSVVVSAPLAPVQGDRASGTASLVERDGTRVLRVDLRAPAPAGGEYYEVWLAEPDLQHMVAVGVLHDGQGTMDLPDGLDVSSYPYVDVSLEPLDGDPAHSAVSVARGRLEG
jgi:Anti-sigma-K factor rskA